MKSISLMVVMPRMAAAWIQWDLGSGTFFYVSPSYTMMKVTGEDNLDRLYQIRNVDIKPLASMPSAMNTTLEIDGVPEFSKRDMSKLYYIPDFCFKKVKP